MREALAANHDLLLDDDRREQKRRAGRGKASKGLGARLFGGRRRAVIFVSLVALAAIGIPLNALYLQDGRHPAPLFRNAAVEPEQPARAAAQRPHVGRAHVEPIAPPAPVRAREPIIDMPAAARAAGTKPAVAARAPAHGAEKHGAEKHGDTIGALLSGHPQKPAEAEKTVKSAQQALAKLGYPVAADGKLGATTRRALETFERANGLPADGAIDSAVLRKLQAKAAAAKVPPAAPAPPPRTN